MEIVDPQIVEDLVEKSEKLDSLDIEKLNNLPDFDAEIDSIKENVSDIEAIKELIESQYEDLKESHIQLEKNLNKAIKDGNDELKEELEKKIDVIERRTQFLEGKVNQVLSSPAITRAELDRVVALIPKDIVTKSEIADLATKSEVSSSRGLTGRTGLQGQKGDTGLKGDVGDAGENGENGENGEDGDKGDKGDKGDIGPIGTIGVIGPMGINGIQGDKGIKGDKGDTGDKGAKGDTGAIPNISSLENDINSLFSADTAIKSDLTIESLRVDNLYTEVTTIKGQLPPSPSSLFGDLNTASVYGYYNGNVERQQTFEVIDPVTVSALKFIGSIASGSINMDVSLFAGDLIGYANGLHYISDVPLFRETYVMDWNDPLYEIVIPVPNLVLQPGTYTFSVRPTVTNDPNKDSVYYGVTPQDLFPNHSVNKGFNAPSGEDYALEIIGTEN